MDNKEQLLNLLMAFVYESGGAVVIKDVEKFDQTIFVPKVSKEEDGGIRVSVDRYVKEKRDVPDTE